MLAAPQEEKALTYPHHFPEAQSWMWVGTQDHLPHQVQLQRKAMIEQLPALQEILRLPGASKGARKSTAQEYSLGPFPSLSAFLFGCREHMEGDTGIAHGKKIDS